MTRGKKVIKNRKKRSKYSEEVIWKIRIGLGYE